MLNLDSTPNWLEESPLIRDASPHDAETIAAIYNYYILNTTITFEESEISSHEVIRRMERVLSADLPYLVLESNGDVCGYCYLTPWKERSAYRHTLESVIYLKYTCTGRGYGTQLYQALIRLLMNLDVHAVIAGVALPNPASIALHKKLGFIEVALLREVGWKFRRWIDLTYWELMTGV